MSSNSIDYGRMIFDMTSAMNKLHSGAYTVYPSYITSCIRRNLKNIDGEQIIREVGTPETIGDCRYAIPVTDFNGKRYRITVEVAD